MSRRTLLVGALDGVAFFVAVIAVWLFSEGQPVTQLQKAFGVYWHHTAFVLAPASMLVAWRGWADAVRIVARSGSWLRLPLEGSCAAIGAVLIFFVLNFLDAAWAAGGVYDGFETWGLNDWLVALRGQAEIAAILASLGAVTGIALTALNRLVLRLSKPSNIGIQPAAFGRG